MTEEREAGGDRPIFSEFVKCFHNVLKRHLKIQVYCLTYYSNYFPGE